MLVTSTGVEGREAVVNGNCPHPLVMETECLNAALLNDGPQTNSSVRTSREQLRRVGEGEGDRGKGRGEEGRGGDEDQYHRGTVNRCQTEHSLQCVEERPSPLHPRGGPHTRHRTTQLPLHSPGSHHCSRQECGRCLCVLGAPSAMCSWRCPRSESSEEKVGVKLR